MRRTIVVKNILSSIVDKQFLSVSNRSECFDNDSMTLSVTGELDILSTAIVIDERADSTFQSSVNGLVSTVLDGIGSSELAVASVHLSFVNELSFVVDDGLSWSKNNFVGLLLHVDGK